MNGLEVSGDGWDIGGDSAASGYAERQCVCINVCRAGGTAGRLVAQQLAPPWGPSVLGGAGAVAEASANERGSKTGGSWSVLPPLPPAGSRQGEKVKRQSLGRQREAQRHTT